ncbi:hypothetical protein AAHA92_22036 [Salvia divinorum]|uniref:Uncharacterized protein n=1 Tax=Salvia divinorum TaxID=28513 RepID=A0ABD1GMD0_SALDI
MSVWEGLSIMIYVGGLVQEVPRLWRGGGTQGGAIQDNFTEETMGFSVAAAPLCLDEECNETTKATTMGEGGMRQSVG